MDQDQLMAEAEKIQAELLQLAGKYYELERDVENPQEGQHRVWNVCTWPVWKKGQRFSVVVGPSSTVGIKFSAVQFNSKFAISAEDPRFQLLLDNAKVVEENFSEFFERNGLTLWVEEMLAKMVDKGIMTRAELVQLKEECEAEADE